MSLSSSMYPLASGWSHRSFHDPVIVGIFCEFQAMPVVHKTYGTVCSDWGSYQGLWKKGMTCFQ